MWIRVRLDIGWKDLFRGLITPRRTSDRRTQQENLESIWSQRRGGGLVCVSVRSGFDLLLQSLELPTGSEVLFSAVTIQDMPRLAASHGLVPVPIDLAGSDFHIDTQSLRQRITSKSRVLVVAHLFGARPDMQEVLEIAREHRLLVVEDCAQAWCGADWVGSEIADVSLFSFGVIKTATALGGALCRVKDETLLARMRELQSQQPVQSTGNLAMKYLKFAVLKAISSRGAFWAIARLGGFFGQSIDEILGGLTRGFTSGSLLEQLRQQPSTAMLKMLEQRITTYDASRLERRIDNGRRIVLNLNLAPRQPELLDPRHSFWLFPLITARPEALIEHLRLRGFDSTQRGRMEIVAPPPERSHLGCPRATEMLRKTVFLPCYPEMPLRAIDQMCDEVLDFESVAGRQTFCKEPKRRSA